MTQEKALAILKSGQNVFLTGQAGAGKTYVLNQYIQYLKERKVGVAITASTGIAATHMNGQTIHAWSGIGVRDELKQTYLNSLKTKKYFTDKMETVKVLIIDEISMLHKRQLELVDYVLRFFKNMPTAFGGIQVVFSGDFFQLPPIGQEYETNRDKFAFMSHSWVEADLKVCYLTEQHRQDDQSLNNILNELRSGELSESSIEDLQETYNNSVQTEDTTRLFTHNADVDSINNQRLKLIEEEPKPFKAKGKGNEYLVETLKKSVLTDETLQLKVGAQVMFIKNNYEKGYFNGTLGEVIRYSDEGFPMVKTRNRRTIEVKQETWSIDDENGKSLASYSQIPLRLAWAITVHKSQGMTLDSAQIDLSKTFEPGQGYVALSRVKNLSGLQLIGMNPMAFQIDTLARKADRRFMELSNEVDAQFSESDLEEMFDSFIEYSGGTTDAKQIKRNREKIADKGKPKKKGSTYERTKDFIDKGHTIAEIADKRGLGKSTIISHLGKLKELYPNLNLEKFKPEEKIFIKIEKAYKSLSPEKRKSVKEIYLKLEGEASYDKIHLALLFIRN